MRLFRSFLCDHRGLAALLLAAALCIKAVMPAGFMLGHSATVLTVQLCSDGSGSQLGREIIIPMKVAPAAPSGEHGKSDQTCPYATLTMASMAGADVPLLAIALAFAMVLAFRRVTPAPVARGYRLRPPLRGPPRLA